MRPRILNFGIRGRAVQMEREKFVPPSTDHDTLTRRMVTLQLLLARREFEELCP